MHDDESVVFLFPIKKLSGFPLGAQLETFSELHSEYSVKTTSYSQLLVCETFTVLTKASGPQRINEVSRSTQALSFQSEKLERNRKSVYLKVG